MARKSSCTPRSDRFAARASTFVSLKAIQDMDMLVIRFDSVVVFKVLPGSAEGFCQSR